MVPKKISKLEIKTRQRLLQIEAAALPGQLQTQEGRKEVFKQFPVHNDQGLAAAKIRIIRKYSTLGTSIISQ